MTQYSLGVYLVLTCLSMFCRPDFMSMTVCCLGIYGLENPAYITRSLFRMLVVFAVITFLYDTCYLLFIHNAEAIDAETGDMLKGTRQFSYIFVWLSFLLRPIVILVLWKDSLNHRQIIRHKQDSIGDDNLRHSLQNKDLELARVMA